MKLGITCDAHWESRLDRVLNDIYSAGLKNLFSDYDYGHGLVEIFVVLMCRDTNLVFKQRIRLVKKTKILFMDIMLNLDQMRQTDDNGRMKIVVERLANEVPSILGKYKLPDFNKEKFVEDLRNWLKNIG